MTTTPALEQPPVPPAPVRRLDPAEQILTYFRSAFLPEPLRTVSQCVEDLARYVVQVIPPSAERTVGVRHLLDSKDALCRAATHIEPPTPGQQPTPPTS
ncbi:hypothetical protein ACN20G_28255 (plasmid) [Streptomyces sp. BI20]|uniref:hypothetical protein n=1 Tax=Streptomyces sp. BI20 TaxID=3403460 RepID=UPI003C749C68